MSRRLSGCGNAVGYFYSEIDACVAQRMSVQGLSVGVCTLKKPYSYPVWRPCHRTVCPPVTLHTLSKILMGFGRAFRRPREQRGRSQLPFASGEGERLPGCPPFVPYRCNRSGHSCCDGPPFLWLRRTDPIQFIVIKLGSQEQLE